MTLFSDIEGGIENFLRELEDTMEMLTIIILYQNSTGIINY
jgi:hypothetical protein